MKCQWHAGVITPMGYSTISFFSSLFIRGRRTTQNQTFLECLSFFLSFFVIKREKLDDWALMGVCDITQVCSLVRMPHSTPPTISFPTLQTNYLQLPRDLWQPCGCRGSRTAWEQHSIGVHLRKDCHFPPLEQILWQIKKRRFMFLVLRSADQSTDLTIKKSWFKGFDQNAKWLQVIFSLIVNLTSDGLDLHFS